MSDELARELAATAIRVLQEVTGSAAESDWWRLLPGALVAAFRPVLEVQAARVVIRDERP